MCLAGIHKTLTCLAGIQCVWQVLCRLLPIQCVWHASNAVAVQLQDNELFQVANGCRHQGQQVVVEVEVSEAAPATHGLRQHHQVVLRDLQETKVVQVAYFLWVEQVSGVKLMKLPHV